MKARHYLLIPALAAMAVSCSNEADVLQPAERTTVRATTEYTPATRTIFKDPTSGEKGYTISLTWNTTETSESIDVAGFDPYGNAISFTNASTVFTGVAGSLTNNDQSMEFTGTPPANEGKVAYFYPSGAFESNGGAIVEKKSFYLPQTQKGNDNLDHLPAVNWMYSDAVAPTANFTLQPLGAIVRFDLTFPTAVTGGRITFSSSKKSFIGSVEITYPGGTISLQDGIIDMLIGIEDINTNRVIAYMMVGAVPDASTMGSFVLNNATLGIGADMTLADGVSEVAYTKSLGTTHSTATWEPGKTYNIVVTAWDSSTTITP
jgi:hypothetical protein